MTRCFICPLSCVRQMTRGHRQRPQQTWHTPSTPKTRIDHVPAMRFQYTRHQTQSRTTRRDDNITQMRYEHSSDEIRTQKPNPTTKCQDGKRVRADQSHARPTRQIDPSTCNSFGARPEHCRVQEKSRLTALQVLQVWCHLH